MIPRQAARFRMPGSSHSSLMHELIALAYHAATVRRLYVGSSALSAAMPNERKSQKRSARFTSGLTLPEHGNHAPGV